MDSLDLFTFQKEIFFKKLRSGVTFYDLNPYISTYDWKTQR